MSNRRLAILLLVFVAAGIAVAVVAKQVFRPAPKVPQETRQSIRVGSGSMVPTFLGSHFIVNCKDCDFVFPCDAQKTSSSIVCPNCGFRQDFPSTAPVAGELVWIDHAAYVRALPKRWDPIAFRQPAAEHVWAVKRVIGLPGERVAIRDGDVYVNDQIQAKPIDVAMTMGVLVHDSKYPAKTASRRWRPASENSGWQWNQGAFTIDKENGVQENGAQENGAQEKDLLHYHNWRCVDSPSPREEDAPIRDSYSYNHSISRTLSDVRDFYLLADLEANDATQLVVVLKNKFDSVEFKFDTRQSTIEISTGGVLVARQENDLFSAGRIALALGLIDQRVFITTNGVTVIEQAIQPGSVRSAETTPLQIGVRKGRVALHRLRVYRDVHYCAPFGLTETWERAHPVDDNSYLVLGDNPPISRDSRDPSFGLIPLGNVLGKTTSE
ncbi:MAG: signal peptidase I [Pirellulaceae bacterium]|jgi:signal peptidase I